MPRIRTLMTLAASGGGNIMLLVQYDRMIPIICVVYSRKTCMNLNSCAKYNYDLRSESPKGLGKLG